MFARNTIIFFSLVNVAASVASYMNLVKDGGSAVTDSWIVIAVALAALTVLLLIATFFWVKPGWLKAVFILLNICTLGDYLLLATISLFMVGG